MGKGSKGDTKSGAAEAAGLPSEQQIRTWVRETLAFYSGYPVAQIDDDQKLVDPPLEIDPKSLVDVAGTLRHGVKNYNPGATILVSDLEDQSVGDITALVVKRIQGA